VRTDHLRNLLRFAQVIDLACKVQPSQRHAEQKTQPGHDAVTIADARSGLGNVKLKAADVLGRRRVRRAFEKRRKPLTAVDMAPLRGRPELTRGHVLDHALTERAGNMDTHRKLLSEVR